MERARVLRFCTGAILVIAAGFSPLARSAEADFSKASGVVVAHSPASTRVYLGSPGICILPDGTYLAKCDLFGPGAPRENGPVSQVFRSSDRGETWEPLCELQGLFWASSFPHRGDIYLLGTGGATGREVVIRRAICHDILHFSARVLASVDGQAR